MHEIEVKSNPFHTLLVRQLCENPESLHGT